MENKIKVAGDKKNTAGEQVYFGKFNFKLKMNLGEGSWVAGFAKTSRRFWLWRQ
jgi:hypothetical protein